MTESVLSDECLDDAIAVFKRLEYACAFEGVLLGDIHSLLCELKRRRSADDRMLGLQQWAYNATWSG